jgi:beta-lactamase class A
LDQKVTVTGGHQGRWQRHAPERTRRDHADVEQAAIKMISVSDNTAADLLLSLVGRAAVERQVERWSSRPSLDIPFLTVSELFALKYDDFPKLADHFLSLGPSARAAYLRSTIDAVPVGAEVAVSSPRDVDTIEWFASPDDLCRAFVGLRSLRAEPGSARSAPCCR